MITFVWLMWGGGYIKGLPVNSTNCLELIVCFGFFSYFTCLTVAELTSGFFFLISGDLSFCTGIT